MPNWITNFVCLLSQFYVRLHESLSDFKPTISRERVFKINPEGNKKGDARDVTVHVETMTKVEQGENNR